MSTGNGDALKEDRLSLGTISAKRWHDDWARDKLVVAEPSCMKRDKAERPVTHTCSHYLNTRANTCGIIDSDKAS